MPSDPATLAAHCRRELAAFDFRPREMAILNLVLRHSLDVGRDFAFFQTQGQIGALAGQISKGNVSTLLSRLTSAGVVTTDPALGRYQIQIDSDRWRVQPLHRSPAHRQAADRLESMLLSLAATAPEQLHLLEPLPDLDALLADENRADILSRFPPHGTSALHRGPAPSADNCGPSVSTRSRDPDTISDEPTASSRRSENEAPSPVAATQPTGEDIRSQIAASLAQYPRNPSSQIRNPVPKSGTPSLSTSLNEETTSLINERSGGKRLVIPDAPAKPQIEREILAEAAATLGDMKKWGGFWRKAIRHDPLAVRDALAEIRLRKSTGRRPKGCWGGLARTLYADFSGLRPAKWRTTSAAN